MKRTERKAPAAAPSAAALSTVSVPIGSTLSAAAPPPAYKTTLVITPAISLMSNQVTQINGTLRRHTSDLSDLGVEEGYEFAAFLGMGQACE